MRSIPQIEFNWRRDISFNRKDGKKDGGDTGIFINLKTES